MNTNTNDAEIKSRICQCIFLQINVCCLQRVNVFLMSDFTTSLVDDENFMHERVIAVNCN